MAGDSSIEWTDRTWNPAIYGCQEVSPGCANCYAATMAKRLGAMGQERYAGLTRAVKAGGVTWTGEVRSFDDDALLTAPLHWKKPRRIFVNSMSDLFHDAVPDSHIDKVFAVMALAPQHTFQVLTKRPERMRAYLSKAMPFPQWTYEGGPWPEALDRITGQYLGMAMNGQIPAAALNAAADWQHAANHDNEGLMPAWPLPNVWLGVSAEDQERADERIPILLDTPAAVRFVSYEPALGPVDFDRFIGGYSVDGQLKKETAERLRAQLNEVYGGVDQAFKIMLLGPGPFLNWIIVGGESGPRARPFNLDWARSVVAQGAAAGVAVFVKQMGRRVYDPDLNPAHLHRWILDDGSEWVPPIIGPRAHVRPDNAVGWVPVDVKGGNPAEWPEDLRVRQFPAGHGDWRAA